MHFLHLAVIVVSLSGDFRGNIGCLSDRHHEVRAARQRFDVLLALHLDFQRPWTVRALKVTSAELALVVETPGVDFVVLCDGCSEALPNGNFGDDFGYFLDSVGRVKLAEESFSPEIQRTLLLGDRSAEVTRRNVTHRDVTHFLNASRHFAKSFGGNSQLALLVGTKGVHEARPGEDQRVLVASCDHLGNIDEIGDHERHLLTGSRAGKTELTTFVGATRVHLSEAVQK